MLQPTQAPSSNQPDFADGIDSAIEAALLRAAANQYRYNLRRHV
ncbi:MAG: hypothetical protein WCH37_04935 [Synechococcaceae cyanobacterium ELA182]